MTDKRFPRLGFDARFPAPGVDSEYGIVVGGPGATPYLRITDGTSAPSSLLNTTAITIEGRIPTRLANAPLSVRLDGSEVLSVPASTWPLGDIDISSITETGQLTVALERGANFLESDPVSLVDEPIVPAPTFSDLNATAGRNAANPQKIDARYENAVPSGYSVRLYVGTDPNAAIGGTMALAAGVDYTTNSDFPGLTYVVLIIRDAEGAEVDRGTVATIPALPATPALNDATLAAVSETVTAGQTRAIDLRAGDYGGAPPYSFSAPSEGSISGNFLTLTSPLALTTFTFTYTDANGDSGQGSIDVKLIHPAPFGTNDVTLTNVSLGVYDLAAPLPSGAIRVDYVYNGLPDYITLTGGVDRITLPTGGPSQFYVYPVYSGEVYADPAIIDVDVPAETSSPDLPPYALPAPGTLDQTVHVGEFGESGMGQYQLRDSGGNALTGVSLDASDPDILVTTSGLVIASAKAGTDRFIDPARTGNTITGTSDQGDFVLTLDVLAGFVMANGMANIRKAGVISQRNGGGHTVMVWSEYIGLGDGSGTDTSWDDWAIDLHFDATTTYVGLPNFGTRMYGRGRIYRSTNLLITGFRFTTYDGEPITFHGDVDVDIVGNLMENDLDLSGDLYPDNGDALEARGIIKGMIRTANGADWAGRFADNIVGGTYGEAVHFICKRAHPRRIIEGNIIRNFAGDEIKVIYQGESAEDASDGVHETGITIRYNVSRGHFKNAGAHSDLHQIMQGNRVGTVFKNYRNYANVNEDGTPMVFQHTTGGEEGYTWGEGCYIGKHFSLSAAAQGVGFTVMDGARLENNTCVYDPDEIGLHPTAPSIKADTVRGASTIQGNISDAKNFPAGSETGENLALGQAGSSTPYADAFVDPRPRREFATFADFVAGWTSKRAAEGLGAFGLAGDVWGEPGKSGTWNVKIGDPAVDSDAPVDPVNPPAEDTMVFSMWGQSLDHYAVQGGTRWSTHPDHEPLLDGDRIKEEGRVTFVFRDNGDNTVERTPSYDDTDYFALHPAANSIIDTLNAQGLTETKARIAMQTKSEKGFTILFGENDSERQWVDDLDIHDTATLGGTLSPKVVIEYWRSANANPNENFGRRVHQLFLGEEIDGTPMTVPFTSPSSPSFTAIHTLDEVYDWSEAPGDGKTVFAPGENWLGQSEITHSIRRMLADSQNPALRYAPPRMIHESNGHPMPSKAGQGDQLTEAVQVALQVHFGHWTAYPEIDHIYIDPDGDYVEMWSDAGPIMAQGGGDQVVGVYVSGRHLPARIVNVADDGAQADGAIRVTAAQVGRQILWSDMFKYGPAEHTALIDSLAGGDRTRWYEFFGVIDVGAHGLKGIPVRSMPPPEVLQNTLPMPAADAGTDMYPYDGGYSGTAGTPLTDFSAEWQHLLGPADVVTIASDGVGLEGRAIAADEEPYLALTRQALPEEYDVRVYTENSDSGLWVVVAFSDPHNWIGIRRFGARIQVGRSDYGIFRVLYSEVRSGYDFRAEYRSGVVSFFFYSEGDNLMVQEDVSFGRRVGIYGEGNGQKFLGNLNVTFDGATGGSGGATGGGDTGPTTDEALHYTFDGAAGTQLTDMPGFTLIQGDASRAYIDTNGTALASGAGAAFNDYVAMTPARASDYDVTVQLNGASSDFKVAVAYDDPSNWFAIKKFGTKVEFIRSQGGIQTAVHGRVTNSTVFRVERRGDTITVYRPNDGDQVEGSPVTLALGRRVGIIGGTAGGVWLGDLKIDPVT